VADYKVVEILLDNRQDPDFPSWKHKARTPLGELCRSWTQNSPGAAPMKEARLVIDRLVKCSNIQYPQKGKMVPLIYLALENDDPVPITRMLLEAGMFKHLNAPFNLYTENNFRYSPTTFVRDLSSLSRASTKSDLLDMLSSFGCEDIFYVLDGPQPKGYAGLPPELEEIELSRQRLERRRQEQEEETRLQRERLEEDARLQALRLDRLQAQEQLHAQQNHRLRLSQQAEISSTTQSLMQAEAQTRLSILQAEGNTQLRIEGQLATERQRAKDFERSRELEHQRAQNELSLAATQKHNQLEFESQKALTDVRMKGTTAEAALERYKRSTPLPIQYVEYRGSNNLVSGNGQRMLELN
jgi:hypothetical protein